MEVEADAVAEIVDVAAGGPRLRDRRRESRLAEAGADQLPGDPSRARPAPTGGGPPRPRSAPGRARAPAPPAARPRRRCGCSPRTAGRGGRCPPRRIRRPAARGPASPSCAGPPPPPPAPGCSPAAAPGRARRRSAPPRPARGPPSAARPPAAVGEPAPSWDAAASMPATARIASQVPAAASRMPASSGSSLRLREAKTSELPGTQTHPSAASIEQAPEITPAGPCPARATRPGFNPQRSSAFPTTLARNGAGSENSPDRREMSRSSGVRRARPVAAASSRSIRVMKPRRGSPPRGSTRKHSPRWASPGRKGARSVSCADGARTSRASQPSSASPAESASRRALISLHVAFDELLEGRLGRGAHHAVGHLAILEQDEGGDARHLELIRELLLLVDVQLGDDGRCRSPRRSDRAPERPRGRGRTRTPRSPPAPACPTSGPRSRSSHR